MKGLLSVDEAVEQYEKAKEFCEAVKAYLDNIE